MNYDKKSQLPGQHPNELYEELEGDIGARMEMNNSSSVLDRFMLVSSDQKYRQNMFDEEYKTAGKAKFSGRKQTGNQPQRKKRYQITANEIEKVSMSSKWSDENSNREMLRDCFDAKNLSSSFNNFDITPKNTGETELHTLED